MDINVEEAVIEVVGVENCNNERFTEFKKYYRSIAETEAILKELGLPALEVLRPQDTKIQGTSKATSNDDNEDNAQGPHKPVLRKERRVKKRANKYVEVKQQIEKVDIRKTKSNPSNNGVISSLEENGTKVNKVHDLADSLQNELSELVIGDGMFIDNNNKNKTQQTTAQEGDNRAQNETRNDNKEMVVRIKGFPAFIYRDIHRCVLVEDWHKMTLKSGLTSLLHVELSKYGVLSDFGSPEKYTSIEHRGMFYVPAYFTTTEAAAKAIEAGSVVIESVEHSLTKALPLTETGVVIRIHENTERRYLTELFKECGRIRKIKHFYKGRKSSSLIVFGDAESAERALSFNKDFKLTRYVERRNNNNTVRITNSTSITNNINKQNIPRHGNKPPVPLVIVREY